MIIVLTIMMIVLIVVGAVLYDDTEVLGWVLLTIGVIGTIAGIIATVWIGVEVSHLSVIDEKIEMYEQENTIIETQISETVKQYQKDANYQYIPVSCEILSDFLTPITALRILKNVSDHVFMLESVEGRD